MSIPELAALGQEKLQQAILRIKPVSQHDYGIKKFTWNEVGQRARFRHFLIAAITLLIILAVAYPLMQVPILQDSIASGIAKIVQAGLRVLGVKGDLTTPLTIGVVILLIAWRKNVKSLVGVGPFDLVTNLPRYALREELMFRTESETWTLWQKIRSCISFGLMHFTMVIVPLGACGALMIAGAILMAVYNANLKTGNSKLATIEAALVHTTYNALIIVVVVLSLFWTEIQMLVILVQALLRLK